jgi:hypothetical protein
MLNVRLGVHHLNESTDYSTVKLIQFLYEERIKSSWIVTHISIKTNLLFLSGYSSLMPESNPRYLIQRSELARKLVIINNLFNVVQLNCQCFCNFLEIKLSPTRPIINTKNEVKSRKLTISNVTEKSFGIYKCLVQADIGNYSESISLESVSKNQGKGLNFRFRNKVNKLN